MRASPTIPNVPATTTTTGTDGSLPADLSCAATATLDCEPTPIGIQSLVPGVAPITLAQRLAARAAAPLEPKTRQRAIDHGLFDLAARNQLDLFPSFRSDAADARRVPAADHEGHNS